MVQSYVRRCSTVDMVARGRDVNSRRSVCAYTCAHTHCSTGCGTVPTTTTATAMCSCSCLFPLLLPRSLRLW